MEKEKQHFLKCLEPGCGYTGTAERYTDLCPQCYSVGVQNLPNIDAPAVNDSRPEKKTQTFEVAPDASVYSESMCGVTR